MERIKLPSLILSRILLYLFAFIEHIFWTYINSWEIKRKSIGW